MSWQSICSGWWRMASELCTVARCSWNAFDIFKSAVYMQFFAITVTLKYSFSNCSSTFVFLNLFRKGWFSFLFYFMLLLPLLINVCLMFPFYCFLLAWLIDCLVYAILRVSYCPYYPLLFMSQFHFSSWFEYWLLSVVVLTFCFWVGSFSWPSGKQLLFPY